MSYTIDDVKRAYKRAVGGKLIEEAGEKELYAVIIYRKAIIGIDISATNFKIEHMIMPSAYFQPKNLRQAQEKLSSLIKCAQKAQKFIAELQRMKRGKNAKLPELPKFNKGYRMSAKNKKLFKKLGVNSTPRNTKPNQRSKKATI